MPSAAEADAARPSAPPSTIRTIASAGGCGYIPSSVPAAAIKTLLISLAYVFLLIAALIIVNMALTRRTREERDAERLRRRQRKRS